MQLNFFEFRIQKFYKNITIVADFLPPPRKKKAFFSEKSLSDRSEWLCDSVVVLAT